MDFLKTRGTENRPFWEGPANRYSSAVNGRATPAATPSGRAPTAAARSTASTQAPFDSTWDLPETLGSHRGSWRTDGRAGVASAHRDPDHEQNASTRSETGAVGHDAVSCPGTAGRGGRRRRERWGRGAAETKGPQDRILRQGSRLG